MTRDEEIRQGLKDAGIPEMVFGTTLVKEEMQTLRTLVETNALVSATTAKGLFLHAKNRASISQARKVFYLVAKELFLSGATVFCLPLSRLIEVMNSTEDTSEMARDTSRIYKARMVFVLDFYEDGTPFPFQAHDAVRVRTWVRSRFEAGNGVSFLSDSAFDRCAAWWPPSFMGFIGDNVLIHSV